MAAPQIVPVIYGQDVKKIHLAEFVASIQSAINTLHLRTSQGVIDAADEIQGYLAQALAAAEAAENAAEETQLVPSGGRFLADGETNTISVSGVYISPYLFSVYVGTEYQHPATYSVSNDGSNTTISFGENFPEGVWVEYTALRKKEVSIAALDLGDVQPFLEMFGLGEDAGVAVSNIDTHYKGGFYFGYGGDHLNATPGTNPYPTQNGAFGMICGNATVGDASNCVFQLVLPFWGTNVLQPKFRFKSILPWTPWQSLYSTANLVGTVSQSGGVPTGAVIESGSTVDGDYTKYADGTMVCTCKVNLGPVTATGAGTWADPYQTAPADAVWARSFISAPAVSIALMPDSVAGGGPLPGRGLAPAPYEPPSTTGWEFLRAIRVGSDTTATSIVAHVTATGRWF